MSGGLPAVAGADSTVRLHDGRVVKVVQLNNAATTPPLVHTLEVVSRFLATYGALHRGAGPRARATVEAVEQAIASIRRFIGCPAGHVLLFTQNTSAAINWLARMHPFGRHDVVATSDVEHTSNNLPWRHNTVAEVVTIGSRPDGALEDVDLVRVVDRAAGRLKLIAVTGASNLTGYMPSLTRLAALAHGAGARLFVDAAQLAPHRPIDMARDGIDMLAFSAHKVYAPFGLGVLAVPSTLLETLPVDPGGGSVDMISERHVTWAPAAERHQTGTWNATGIVALGASCEAILAAGWDAIVAHERRLVRYASERLAAVAGLRLHVAPRLYADEDRIGTFPFSLEGYHQALLASILEMEHGIEVRAGTICNHRLVRRWFDVADDAQAEIERRVATGDRLATYGVARASLGLHSVTADIDALADALVRVREHGPRLRYRPLPAEEAFEPIGAAGVLDGSELTPTVLAEEGSVGP